jgi:DNA-binding response OmpR family regulator
VIEDERHVSALLAQLLRSLGFAPFEAATTAAAETYLLTATPALVLLDLRLPGRSGDDWLQWFRRHDSVTPVMAISGVTDPLRRAAVLRCGADAFISKPFDVVELEAHIAALLRRPRSESGMSICDGLVWLNPARSELRVGAVAQHLTQREFQILWSLALNEGNWVTGRSLATAILDDGSHAGIESTRVHLFNLRQKLRYLCDYFYVEKARNLGYRIVRCIK